MITEELEPGSSLLEHVRRNVVKDGFWWDYIGRVIGNLNLDISVHVGIFQSPYLERLLDGTKTIESRFSSVRCAPYRQVGPGDIILVKRPGGPIVAIFQAGEVWNHKLTPRSLEVIRDRFGVAISPASPTFWQENESALFATLIGVENVRQFEPVPWVKADRRGWVVLKSRRDSRPTLFE